MSIIQYNKLVYNKLKVAVNRIFLQADKPIVMKTVSTVCNNMKSPWRIYNKIRDNINLLINNHQINRKHGAMLLRYIQNEKD